MRLIRRLLLPLYWLYCVYALLLFVVGMFCVLPFVVVLPLWGDKKGGDYIYQVCYWWAWCWMMGVGIGYKASGSRPDDRGSQYIFVANHISYLDIPMIFRAMGRRSFRILGKAEMAKVPVFGYIYRRAVVMVDRSNAQQRSKSVRMLKSALAMGTSIFIFPEGTFNETHQPLKSFYDGAFRIAIETGTPVQPILFPDNYDRMNYASIFLLRPGRTRAIYLDAVPVEGLTMADVPLLRERVFRVMEEALIRYKASWILFV